MLQFDMFDLKTIDLSIILSLNFLKRTFVLNFQIKIQLKLDSSRHVAQLQKNWLFMFLEIKMFRYFKEQ